MNKPLKRHPFIVEFSKDHHHGLLLVWKIREGLKKNIPTKRIVNYIHFFAANELLPHFKEEEKYLLPLLSETDHLRKQVEAEHSHLRQLLSAVGHDSDPHALLKNLASLLEAHIRFEERNFFPHLEKAPGFEKIDPAAIKTTRNIVNTEWTDNFWESEKQVYGEVNLKTGK